ncbi:MAG: Fic family protein [candidate division Zixibacteria bacterium]|nr:Fic family protein [candidate division Zixibacteria bacterium]
MQKHQNEVREYAGRAQSPRYLFWDKVRYLARPDDVTAEEFWAFIKTLRNSPFQRTSTLICDEKGDPFSWLRLPGMEEFLHVIDMELGGTLASIFIDDPTVRRRFISRGIMEEAIASSQLEGANTTRKAAKRMLSEKHKPANRSEQMILNNYCAMLEVEESLKSQPMTMTMLMDLHRILTENTLPPADIGRLRTNSDDIAVADASTGVIYHIPPSEEFLRQELPRLIQYANDEIDERQFIHPVIKAIFLHFWIGYLHPFVDGNGRLARILFYWYVIKKGYWAFAYLPISRVIKASPAQYRDAYIYSEQDDNDLTYFLDYNIRKLAQAKRVFVAYAKRKTEENRRMTRLAREEYGLNDRQIQLLRHLHKNPDAATSIRTHARVYGISQVTARKDLEGLEEIGFLTSKKIGRDRPFRATEKTAELF